ncbi:MAG: Tol-Pal system subunit TolQ, partial [Pelagibacterales bacterium]|nr:Tol-Pal system subunit TolQ [Pelagibacterales bacterium]
EKLYKEEEENPKHPLTTVFVAGMYEWTRASDSNSLSNEKIQAGLQERIHQVMNVAVIRELENIEKNIGFLATVGSTAPFIGLFGTVWGIMNSFQSIALSKDTSLAVVAPGIAEALLATALGLVAAIPAVIAYNKLSNNLNTYALRLQNFASEFESLLSRHLSDQSTKE